MKFQALGSHYDFAWAMRQLFATGSKRHSAQLVQRLERRYGGKAYLYDKGRNALSEAVRVSIHTDTPLIAVNALTCSVVVEAIDDTAATPVYIDVDPHTAHFTADALEKAFHARPAISAVIVQNTYGRPCDIAAIEAVVRKFDALLIEDLAHSIGQTYPDGREVGTVGDLVMLSFGRDKLLDAVNGGALIVRSQHLTETVVAPNRWPRLRTQWQDRIYPILTWKVRSFYVSGLGKALLVAMYKFGLARRSADGGINRSLRLPHWQAKLVLKRLDSLEQTNLQRREHMSTYERYFGDELVSKDGTLRAAIAVADRAQTLKELRAAGYELRDTWYDTPIGPARKYATIAYPTNSLPIAVELAAKLINLPTHSHISTDDIERISAIVRRDV